MAGFVFLLTVLCICECMFDIRSEGGPIVLRFSSDLSRKTHSLESAPHSPAEPLGPGAHFAAQCPYGQARGRGAGGAPSDGSVWAVGQRGSVSAGSRPARLCVR